MKAQIRIFIVMGAILLTSTLSLAQNYNGEITYTVGPNFTVKSSEKDTLRKKNKELDAVLSKMFAPEENAAPVMVLKFNSRESLVEPIESMDNDAVSFDFGAISASAMGTIYMDFSSMTSLLLDESFGEPLLVTDSLNRFRWTLSNEKKEIGGYTCFKATGVRFNYEDEGIKEVPITAWYTPEIPIPTGPDEYGGLPGLILELNIRKWKSIRAHEIKLKKKEVKIKKPSKGKQLTRAEYEKLFEGY